MNETLESIEEKITNLPKDQRLTIAHRILKASEPEETQAVDALWDAEIIDRIEKLDHGNTITFSLVDTLKDADDKLAK